MGEERCFTGVTSARSQVLLLTRLLITVQMFITDYAVNICFNNFENELLIKRNGGISYPAA